MLKETIDFLEKNFKIEKQVIEADYKVMMKINNVILKWSDICEYNSLKVLNAFRKNGVSDSHFTNSSGYGYSDIGREVIENIYRDIFSTKGALVRPHFVNGTHAIVTAMFGNLLPGDTLYAISGKPYDTLVEAIGINGKKGIGSMADYNINYIETSLKEENFDIYEIEKNITENKTIKMVHIQRSTGYAFRDALTIEKIKNVINIVKKINSEIICFVDNCYGEFLEIIEPTNIGADLMAGSLIKNIGGGITPAGGYIVGNEKLVENASYRLTTPGIGGECGATFGLTRIMLQGLFLAPKTTIEAVKVGVYASAILSEFGFDVLPKYNANRSDIITAIKFNNKDKLIKFCKEIQKVSPVDSMASCEPWEMPGYEDEIIMAAGAFIQGSSIELSCDAPIREPYIGYLQGGLTFEHGRYAVMSSLSQIL